MGPPRGCLVMLLLAMLMAGRLLQGTEKQTQEEQEKLDDQLIEAVRNKDLVLVNSLVKKGANVNAVEEVGPLFATGQRTPLLEAIRLGDPSLVEALLKLGAQGNLPDVHGATPLAEAAAIGWGPEHPQADGEKILNLLIKSGAKVNANQGKESSPLAYAASHELSSVKLLLKAGAKIDLTVLEGAAVSGHPEILAELLKQGGQATELLPHHQTLYHSVASIFWRTDLLSSQKRIEVLDLLWQAHVPVDVADDDGDTPLHLAAVRGHVPMVRWLLEHQADPNQIDKDGHRPLWYAARNGPMFVSMALLLRKHGAEVEGGAEADVFTTLIEQNNWPALVPMFDAGWRPRSAIRFAFALTRCETERHVPPELLPAMMDRLIPLIKDINEKDDEGLSLLIWLVKAGDDKTLRILLKQRALKVDQRDAMGRTALIWSGMVASQPIHQMLLQAGADAGLRDEAGRSAADYLKLSEVGAGKKDSTDTDGSALPKVQSWPDTDIFDAINSNDTALLRQLLKKDRMVLADVRFGLEPLHLAAALGRKECFAIMMQAGAEGAVNEWVISPAVVALTHGQVAIALEWLKRHAGAVNEEEAAEAYLAALDASKKTNFARALFDAGMPLGTSGWHCLQVAAQQGDDDFCRKLMSRHVSMLRPEDLESHRAPFSVVGDALKSPNLATLELLLSYAEAELPCATRQRAVDEALAEACGAGQDETADLLITRGLANVNALSEIKPGASWSSDKMGPIEAAVYAHQVTVLKVLCRHGAKISGKDGPGFALLEHTLRNQSAACFDFLLEQGADVTSRNPRDETLLHLAAARADEHAVRRLLAAGADPKALDKQQRTAADIAHESGSETIAELLEEFARRAETSTAPRAFQAKPGASEKR